mgnify:CR=1 FL=1
MAQVKLSNQIVSLRGRYGGVYFKAGRPGQHIQAMPRHVNYVRMGSQGAYVRGYSILAGIWGLILVADYSLIWVAFAIPRFLRQQHKEPKKITGYFWDIVFSVTRPETDAPPFWKPPLGPDHLPDFYCVVEGMQQYRIKDSLWPLYYPGGYYYVYNKTHGRWNFKEHDRGWFIWWNGTVWVMTKQLGWEDPPNVFYSVGDKVNDTYINPDRHITARVWIGNPNP